MAFEACRHFYGNVYDSCVILIGHNKKVITKGQYL